MIEIQNLHLHYPDGTRALKGIDLAISEGEFLLICGPNGSGKTTLIRLISGLLKPTSGSVHVNGLNPINDSSEVRRMVGMVFQDPDSQIVGETVKEDVAFGPENLGLPVEEITERVDWALQVMGLKDLSEKPCYLLSGGEKRRLAIAGVLAMRPQVVLFDEPFSFLDYPGIREVLKHMVRLHREGHTLIVTTHDVEKVIAHVDRIAIIHDGELKVAGPPEELMMKLSQFGIRPPCYALLGREKVSWLE
ncbi:MAG: ABC transporter ATP-binding protein [Deltaproteobacteria bacterium CG_4_8_14_3_um_filter_45_9]|nr:MAG: ABC transporter ATP-binding protein [Deltaproteobacteria bacterium CG03_land_8_20_14_0_80_45_14]PIX24463.1 MAG: ABC transporter ATP-binding protein [Deltaproteobacteria bacterium CG_4_8_14_3_um_filter_45_9]